MPETTSEIEYRNAPDCLDPETIRNLATGHASDLELERAAEHLVRCEPCRKSFDSLLPICSPAIPGKQDHEPQAKFDRSTLATADLPDLGDHLRAIRLIGKGGMGCVYECFDNRLGRKVAVKTLNADRASGRFVERMEREARIQASLRHPGIVAIYEAGLFGGQPAIVMELVLGDSLKTVLAERPLAPRDAATLLAAAARAIHHAHEKGVLHRDIKPANILLERTAGQPGVSNPTPGSPRIADFGLAKIIDDDSDLSRSEIIVGTPVYCSPEQIRGGRKGIDRRSDIYSLGTVLYECLTGRPPFNAISFAEISASIETKPPISPRTLVPGLSLDLTTICLKCLEKDPKQRYDTAEDLARDLEAFLRGRPIKARPISPAVHAWRWCRRNPGLAAGVAVSVASMIALTASALIFASVQANLRKIASENGYQAVRQSEIANLAVERANDQRDQARLLFVASSRVLHEIGNMLNVARFQEPSVERGRQIYVEFQKRLLDLSDLYLKRNDLDEDSPDLLPLSIYNAARAHATLGNDAQAIRHYEWLIELNGSKPPTTIPTETYRHLVTAGMLDLAEIYARVGQKAKAIALLLPYWKNPVDPVTGQSVNPMDRGFRQLRIFFGEKLKALYYDNMDKPNFERMDREVEQLRRAALPLHDNGTKPPTEKQTATSN